MLKSLVALVALCAATVSAQTPPISVTQPLTGFTWVAGQTYVIAWVNPVVSNISQIWLASGESTALTKVELVAQNVPTAPLSYSWTIDPKLTTGQYSLEFGLAPNIAYAGPFTITGSGAAASGSAAPAANGTDSAAPSAASAPATSAAAGTSAAASPAAPTPAAAGSSSAAAAAGSPSSAASAPATTSKSNSAKMVAPVALLALVPAVVALL